MVIFAANQTPMKRISLSLLIIIALFFCISSCQKEVLDPNATATLSGDFTAKINGVQFDANQVRTATIMNGVIAIAGRATDGRQIILRVADSSVHTYTLDINSFSNAGAYQADSVSAAFTTNQGSTPAQSGGTLSISRIDAVNHTMSGVFTMNVFRALDSSQKVITDGIFNNIHYDTAAAPAASTDSFRVKIDGVDFPAYTIIGFSSLGSISVSGSNQSLTKTVGLNFPFTTVPGTYPMDLLTYIGQYNPDATTFLTANTGTLTILENNATTKRVRGNFAFHAQPFLSTTPQATLTEGYFSVVYF
jgi:hypothetical protein